MSWFQTNRARGALTVTSALTAVALAFPGVAAAEDLPAPTLSSGSDQVKVTLSGQINRAVMFADDGEDAEFFHVDNVNSSSRMRISGMARLNDDISAGTRLEVQIRENRSDRVRLDDRAAPFGSDDGFDTRWVELHFQSERFGRIGLGQGSTASDGTSEEDLSGTSVAHYSGVGDIGGGIDFIDEATRERSGVRIGDAFNNLDGLSRRTRLRYDTPTFEGFSLGGSWIDNGVSDVALRYGRDIQGTRIRAAGAYANASSDDGWKQWNGSFSVLLPMGLNGTVAGGVRKLDTDARDDDPNFVYGKLGYRFDAFQFGETAVSVDYWSGNNFAADGDDSQSFGIAAVQNVSALGTELYAMARRFQYDRSAANFDDVDVAMVGARVRF